MNTSLLMPDRIDRELKQRTNQKTLRHLRPIRPVPGGQVELEGRVLVNFSSNDYLGLSQDPVLIERSIQFTRQYGTGSGASRLLSGNLDVYEQIELKLARLKGSEAALILPTGFQTNSSVLPCLLQHNSVAAVDRLVHRSILDGVLLSKARWFRFQHVNYMDMKDRLKRLDDLKNRWLLTESIFSMDGDKVDFLKVMELARKSGLEIFIDEAHATGVIGNNGMGLTAGYKFAGISMGTFGKGLGSFGAYVCCSSKMRDYLINFCPGLIYSTALPPSVLGAIDAALDIVPEMDKQRRHLFETSAYLRHALEKLGFHTGSSDTQIIPVVLGTSEAALDLSSYLENNGFFVPAIRPPTVAEGSSRLRISLSCLHTKTQVDEFLKVLRKWHEKKN